MSQCATVSPLSPARQNMAATLLRCIQCTKASDAAVRRQDEDSEMRPFTGEDENEEEPGEVLGSTTQKFDINEC